jgi:hypothetical protein
MDGNSSKLTYYTGKSTFSTADAAAATRSSIMKMIDSSSKHCWTKMEIDWNQRVQNIPEDTVPSISSAPTRCLLLKLGTADIFFWQDRSVEEEERNQQYNIITSDSYDHRSLPRGGRKSVTANAQLQLSSFPLRSSGSTQQQQQQQRRHI